MNIFALSGLLIAITSGVMAILMFMLGKKKLHYLWGIFCISAFFWGAGGYIIATTTNIDKADFWWRVTHIGIIFIPILFTHFVYELLKIKKRWFIVAIYLLGVLFLITNFIDGLFIANMRWVFNQFYYDSPPGPFYIPFTALFFGLVIHSLIKLWQAFKVAKGVLRIQIKYLFAGMAISFAGGGLSFLPVYKIDLYPIFNLTAFLFTIIVGYTILRYRLMDLRIVARNIIAYLSIAAFAYTVFYGITFFQNKVFGSVYATGAYLVGTLFALGFVLIFFPLQKFLQKVTSKYLFANLYNYQQTINNLTNKLTTIINLDQIIDLIVDTIRNTMQLDRSGVLLIDESKTPTQYQIARVTGFKKSNGISLVKDSFLTKHLTSTQKPLVKEELDFLMESAKNKDDKDGFSKLKNHMTRIEASLCLPLISKNKLTGIIVLGAKVSGDAYTKEDLELLNILSNQAAIAIENARLYKQVQDFNKTLQSKVDEQTKDIQEKAAHLEKLLKMRSEFLDIASHQLRTPTSIIKGTLAMMREGDMDKMSDAEKTKFVEGMFQKSVKLESIINDILVASEMDTADFDIRVEDEIELDKFVEKEFQEHQFDASEKKLTLTFEKLTDGPFKIKGSAKYLEQVITNLLDNAIKYTPKGSIKATIKNDKQNAIVAISDTGIGIPKSDIERIFNKFIRGQNARNVYTDGSGLGLFIIKRVMDRHPDSKVWVESEENKGATFYLQFPLMK